MFCQLFSFYRCIKIIQWLFSFQIPQVTLTVDAYMRYESLKSTQK